MLSKHITGQLLAALFLELTGEQKAYFLNHLGRGAVSIPEDFSPIDFQYVEVEGDYAIQYLHEQQEGYAVWEDYANNIPPEFHEIGEIRTIAGDVHPPCHILQKVSDYYKNAPMDAED